MNSRALLTNNSSLGLFILCAFLPVHAADLKQETLQAWNSYVQNANARAAERIRTGRFLWIDDSPDRVRRVRAGEVLVSPLAEHTPSAVPHGLIHDWIGATFIPNARLDDILAVVRDYGRYKEFYRPTVIDSKPIAQPGPEEDKFAMVMLNKSLFLKTALESEYDSSYTRVDSKRCYGISYTTRVQEIEEYGQAAEHKLPPDHGSGYIWRLYSFSRFVERDGGVYVELEAIALSRDVPLSLRWMVDPIVRRVSRNSLITSLHQTSEAVLTGLATTRDSSPSSGVYTFAGLHHDPTCPAGSRIACTASAGFRARSGVETRTR